MSCPKCGAETGEGQNYCGACGAQLQNACSACGTVNPPFFKYCGRCGRNLLEVGAVLLDRAGLILAADATALRIIGQKAGAVKGKPFSLFVRIDDLVVFYSHWNELMRSSKRQSVEIELATSVGAATHAQIEMGVLRGKAAHPPRVHLALSDVTDLRLARQDAQTMQDLINLIFSWADALHDPAGESGRETTIAGVLENVGLFTGVPYGFISRIDGKANSLVTDFVWRLPSKEGLQPPPPPIPIALMARIFKRLSRDGLWIVDDAETLSDLERKSLRQWHRMEVGAILCYMVHRRRTPAAVIGLASARRMHWSDHAAPLLKLAGRLMAETLPYVRPGTALIQPRRSMGTAPSGAESAEPLETVDIADIEIIEEPPARSGAAPAGPVRRSQGPSGRPTTPRMKFGSDKKPGDQDRKPVFAGEDGKFLMTCPRCGFQDTVSARLFEVMGSAVRVLCPCSHRFRIIRELRTTYRKQVRLEGYFALARHSGNKLTPGEVWGPMVVQDLSRNGMKFTCRNAGLLRPGDRLHVRFNLDNANQTLIKKNVIVKSVKEDAVGGQFHGTDRYDAAIGFYFL